MFEPGDAVRDEDDDTSPEVVVDGWPFPEWAARPAPRKPREVRSTTLSRRGNSEKAKRFLRLIADVDRRPVDIVRPSTRADCAKIPRPCPFVGCKHSLYLDVSRKTGAIKINFPDNAPSELKHSCTLDLADEGGLQLEKIGEAMDLTRERVRQIEARALSILHGDGDIIDLAEDEEIV